MAYTLFKFKTKTKVLNKETINNEHIESLVLQVQEGELGAFDEIYETYFTQLYRYLYYRVPKEEVEDLVEIVFFKVWKNIDKYKQREGARFSSWLFKIASNAVADFFRNNQVYVELDYTLEDDSVESDPVYLTEVELDKQQLTLVLDKLKDIYKEVIVLKYVNGMNNKEIADILQIKEDYVRQLQFRALKKMKDIMKKMNLQL